MTKKNWNVIDILSDDPAEVKRIYCQITGEENENYDETYQITILYDRSDKFKDPYQGKAKKLTEYNFKLKAKKAVLSVWKNELFSAEAIENPPIRLLYDFMLLINDRYLISRTYNISIKQNIPDFRDEPDEKKLPQDAYDLLSALLEKNKSKIKNSDIVLLGGWLTSTEKQLSKEPMGYIFLESCRLKIGEEISEATIAEKSMGEKQIRIPSYLNDSLSIFPVFTLHSVVPYNDHVEIIKSPLPSYAYMKLENYNLSLDLTGVSTGKEGEFQIGPFQVNSLQKLKLYSILPLRPPGDQPSSLTTVLFRNGRPVEKFLDTGKKLPVPELPEKFTPEMVIPEIAKQLNAAINPDEPITSLVNNEDYLDFYASAFNFVNKYPELKKLLEEALLSETKLRKAFLFNSVEDLSASSYWTMDDAWLVLNNPALAEKLVLKLEKHPDPLKEKEPYTKENIIEPISENSAEYDTVSYLPHVLAAAALTISNSDIYYNNIEQQVGFFLKKYKLSNYKKSDLEYIVKVGQALKLLANNFTKTSFSDSIEQILQTLKDEVYIRFRDNYKNLNLHQKIQTAHFLSDVWRSYLNTPDFMVVKMPENFAPEQMIVGPDGDNITGKVLDNERYRYSVALEHAINYIKISGKTIPAKYNWMDNFLKDWYSYLFNVHKGGFLQAHESKLEEDKIRAYKEIGVYEYYIKRLQSDDEKD